MTSTATKPFPCPFCESSRVVLVGGGLVFLHYQCAQCSEVWTAMASVPKIHRPRKDEENEISTGAIPANAPKLWLN
jgi:hypothetical protein